MPGFLLWGSVLIGNYLAWMGGGKKLAEIIGGTQDFYRKNLEKKIKRFFNVEGIRKEIKITRIDEAGLFKLRFDDVSIYNPYAIIENSTFYNKQEDDQEVIAEFNKGSFTGELSAKSSLGDSALETETIDYYVVDLSLKDVAQLDRLKLGEIDFGNWDDLFEINIFNKETNEVINKESDIYIKILETLNHYAKLSASRGLPNDKVQDKLVVENKIPILGFFINSFNTLVRGKIVNEQLDLEGNEDGNEHIKSQEYLKSMGELLLDKQNEEVILIENYYKAIRRDLENQKKLVEEIRQKFVQEIQEREKERFHAKLKLSLIIIGSILVIGTVLALFVTAVVFFPEIFGPIFGSALTIFASTVWSVAKKGVSSLFSFPFFSVSTVCLITGLFTKGRTDYKKQRLEIARNHKEWADQVINDLDEEIANVKKDQQVVLEKLRHIKDQQPLELDLSASFSEINLPLLANHINNIPSLTLHDSSHGSEETVVLKIEQLLNQVVPYQNRLEALHLDCRFTDLSELNQQKLLTLAKSNLALKAIKTQQDPKDNERLLELYKVCTVNRYLTGNLLEKDRSPKEYFQSDEEWQAVIDQQLYANYDWGWDGNRQIDSEVIKQLTKANDRYRIYAQRNALCHELGIKDFYGNPDEIKNNLLKKLNSYLKDEEKRTLEDKLSLIGRYWEALDYLDYYLERNLSLIEDFHTLKIVIQEIEDSKRNSFLKYLGFNEAEQLLLRSYLEDEQLSERDLPWINDCIQRNYSRFVSQIISELEQNNQNEKLATRFNQFIHQLTMKEMHRYFSDNTEYLLKVLTKIEKPNDVQDLAKWLTISKQLVNSGTNQTWGLYGVFSRILNHLEVPIHITELEKWLNLEQVDYDISVTNLINKKIKELVWQLETEPTIERLLQFLALQRKFTAKETRPWLYLKKAIEKIINTIEIKNVETFKQYVDLITQYPNFKALFKNQINNYLNNPNAVSLLDVVNNWESMQNYLSKSQLFEIVKNAFWVHDSGWLMKHYKYVSLNDQLLVLNDQVSFFDKLEFSEGERYLFIELSRLHVDYQKDRLLEYMDMLLGCNFKKCTLSEVINAINSDIDNSQLYQEELNEKLKLLVQDVYVKHGRQHELLGK